MTTERDFKTYPKTRKERIAVLRELANSSKTITINGTNKERVVFESDASKVLMGVLNPWDDFTYEWTASALPDFVTTLEENGEFDRFHSDEAFEYADSMVSIYNNELMEWASGNIERVDESLKELGSECGLITAISHAQHGAILEHLAQMQSTIEEYLDSAEVQ